MAKWCDVKKCEETEGVQDFMIVAGPKEVIRKDICPKHLEQFMAAAKKSVQFDEPEPVEAAEEAK